MVAVNAAWFLIPYFREQITELRWTYSMVAFWIGISLWIWWLWRIGIRPKIAEILVGGLAVLPMLISNAAPALNQIGPHPLSLLLIVVPALAHLLVESRPRILRRKF